MTTKLTFYGATGMVTGSNFLLESDNTKILVDCGFFQGCNMCDVRNLSPFPYDPKKIDVLFVTHAHLDHIGRIPKLVKDGFRGKIVSTLPTKDISELMYFDSLHILEEEAKEGGYELVYGKKDVEKTLELWETVAYHEKISAGSFDVLFRDAGHILGSAMVECSRGGKKVVFTGDLGNSPTPLLHDTESIADASYLIMESVYGDRNHEDRAMRREKLEDVIEETIKRESVLMIPAFSIERTQEMLYEIETMIEQKRIPPISVYLDSPLAIKVTEVYKKYTNYFKEEIQHTEKRGSEPFMFPGLTVTPTKEESKSILHKPNPKIIIAGSGMSYGGRILFHEKAYLSDPEHILLFVGYQAPGSPGREIQDGAREIKILHEKIPVRATIKTITGYSAHKGMDDLISFASYSADTLRKVFVVIGEPRSSSFLTQRVRDYLGVEAVMPQEGESFELDI